MINRRILRVKAMQALYSYFLSRDAIREVIKEELSQSFAIDPAIHDFGEKAVFEDKQRKIANLYDENVKNGNVINTLGFPAEDIAKVNQAISQYYEQIGKEKRRIKANLSHETRGLYKQYIKILLLPGELALLENDDQERQRQKFIKDTNPWFYHFATHSVVAEITSSSELFNAATENKVSWVGDKEFLRTWYRDVLKEDSVYKEFQQQSEAPYDKALEVLIYILKKLVLVHPVFEAYWMEQNLNWAEDKAILQAIISKTLKAFVSDDSKSVHLLSLTQNGEEEFEYLEKLFGETLAREAELDDVIVQKTKNWDLSRIAIVDMVILKLALTEMICFPSIPVKVTINEFIEVSKNYSTPKSKQFINGILDVLSNQLTSDGTIRKSGRGLIDNK